MSKVCLKVREVMYRNEPDESPLCLKGKLERGEVGDVIRILGQMAERDACTRLVLVSGTRTGMKPKAIQEYGDWLAFALSMLLCVDVYDVFTGDQGWEPREGVVAPGVYRQRDASQWQLGDGNDFHLRHEPTLVDGVMCDRWLLMARHAFPGGRAFGVLVSEMLDLEVLWQVQAPWGGSTVVW